MDRIRISSALIIAGMVSLSHVGRACGQETADRQVDVAEDTGEATYIWTPDGGVQYIGEGEESRHRNKDGYYAEPGVAYMVIPIPPPIRAEDIERWTWMTGLSEAQARFFVALFDAYAREELEYHDREVQELWDRSAEYASRRQWGFDVAWAEEVEDFFRKDCARAGAGLAAIEARLFDGLVPMLTEEQLGLLEQVRHQRERQCDNSAGRFLTGDLDITLLLYDLFQADYDLTPVDVVLFEDEMAAYDAAATALFRSRSEIKTRNVAKAGVIEHTQMSIMADAGGPGGMTNADRQSVNELKKRLARLNRQIYEAERRVHELNERSAEAIVALLPEETGSELVRRFEMIAYPFLYPDPTDPAGLFQAVAGVETLTDEQRESLEAFISFGGETHSRISAVIREHYIEWHKTLAIRWEIDPAEQARYVHKMDELQAARAAAVQLAAEQIRATLTSDQLATVEDTIESFEAGIASIDFMPAGYDTQMAREWYERNKGRLAGIE